MDAGFRLKLRTASIFLLGMAASISLCASVPAPATSAPAAQILAAQPGSPSYDAAIRLTLPGFPLRASTRNCIRPELATLSNTIGRHSARRTFIFVEDTTPPSSDALKTAQLQNPPRPQTPPFPVSEARRSPFTSVSNRQRAP